MSGLRASRRGVAPPRPRPSGEEGYTILEIMVIVLIIAILIAMAAPAYVSSRSRVQQRAAQSNVVNAFEAERIILASTGEVSSDVTTTLPETEPNFHWLADVVPTNAVRNTVVASVGTISTPNDTVVLGGKADDGVCFYLRAYVGAAVQYAKDAACSSATNSLVSGATNPSGGWRTGW